MTISGLFSGIGSPPPTGCKMPRTSAWGRMAPPSRPAFADRWPLAGRHNVKTSGILPERVFDPQGPSTGPREFADRRPGTGIRRAVAIASRLGKIRDRQPSRRPKPGAFGRHRRCRHGGNQRDWTRRRVLAAGCAAVGTVAWAARRGPPARPSAERRGRTRRSRWGSRATPCAATAATAGRTSKGPGRDQGAGHPLLGSPIPSTSR